MATEDVPSVFHSLLAASNGIGVVLIPTIGGLTVGLNPAIIFTPAMLARRQCRRMVILGPHYTKGVVETRAGIGVGLASLITLSTAGRRGAKGRLFTLLA